MFNGRASNNLIWTGGCALNCAASMHLLDQFNNTFYERVDILHNNAKETDSNKIYNKKSRTLHLWVPPFPSDPGVAAGSVYTMAMQANIDHLSINPLRHAFYCGTAFNSIEIQQTIYNFNDIGCIKISDSNNNNVITNVANFLAYAVGVKNMVLGIFQGIAETG